MGGAFVAVAVFVAIAAKRCVELVDVINRAGFGQVFVNHCVDECFGRWAVGCLSDGTGIQVADEEIGGFELAFVFSAGGDEEMFRVVGTNAEISAGAEQPSVVVECTCGVEHVVGGVLVLMRVMRHGESSLEKKNTNLDGVWLMKKHKKHFRRLF